ncbi:MAG: ATP-grasp domain-containing protein [Actinomycetota bacterium]
MAELPLTIGLSLGADLEWPIFYEDIIARLNPKVPRGDDTITFRVERVTIEPFTLRQPVRYAVLLDRLTHWYHTSREWIKKAVVFNDLYVFNNPFTVQSMEKHTSYAAMMRLGLPIPRTLLLPPKEYDTQPDLQVTLEQYARLFDLGRVAEEIGYPCYMKPFDGGAWRGVSRIENEAQLRAAYEQSGRSIMHLQEAVEPFDLFVRTLAVGPQVNVIRYDPAAPLHDRYKIDFNFVNADEWQLLADMVLTINSFFNWDFNSCESLRKDGEFYPIDFANACPDSQVTSLHYHLPWLVKAKIRWSLFVAATGRRVRHNPDWTPYLEIAATEMPYRQKLAAYAAIAHRLFETERFLEFCDNHLADLDEITWEYFASDRAHEAVRRKVEVIFPIHEVDTFTEHYWGLLQFWRSTERDRLNSVGSTPPAPPAPGGAPLSRIPIGTEGGQEFL